MRVRLAGVFIVCYWLLCSSVGVANAQTSSGRLGTFDAETDLGVVTPPGTAKYDAGSDAYEVAAAGANIWSTTDAFHFAWKKVSGDISLTADISFLKSAGNPDPHRKAVLMLRQSLDADGVYVDAAQHGSGMTALQYRRERGATTQDIELNIDPPQRLRLEKRGDTMMMFVSNHGEPLHQVGVSTKLHLEAPFLRGDRRLLA